MKNEIMVMHANGTATCRICGLHFVPSENEALHQTTHADMARGGLPYAVREFMKAFGYAVARNQRLDHLKGSHDPETGKLAVAYAWWARARCGGIREGEFDAFMEAHLRYLDADDEKESEAASQGIKLWEKYAG